jgi:hypothetical protein
LATRAQVRTAAILIKSERGVKTCNLGHWDH